MDIINEFTMIDPAAITEKSDRLPDQVIAEIELMEQQPQQFNDVSVFGSFSMHHSRCDTAYLDEMIGEFGSETPELDSELGLHSVTDNSNCDTRLPDVNLNGLADEIFTLKIQTKQQQEMILDLKVQVKTLTDILRENSQTMLGEKLHQTQVEEEGMAQHVTSQTQLEIDENDKVMEKGRSPLSDCSGGMVQLQEMETVRSPATEKCTGILNNRSNNDVEHHDESEEVISSDINGANQQNFLGEKQQLHLIQEEQEPMVDNATTNGRLPEECNEKNVSDAHSENDDLCDAQQNNEMEKKVQSASSYQENNCVQSEGSSPIKLILSVRNREEGAKEITPSSGDTDASSKASRASHTKTYSCGECNKRFNFQCDLNKHLRVHSGEKPYKCNKCNAAFNQLSNLKVHQRIHSGEKPYSCTDCNAAFNHAGNLKTHQRIHSGEKPYKCTDCNVAFSHAGKLKIHQRTHSDEKFYKCDECNVAFNRLYTLKTHQRIHTDDTPFSCDICKKSFKHKISLSTHMDIHRGIESYKCKICKKGFRQKGNLTRHLRNHHPLPTRI